MVMPPPVTSNGPSLKKALIDHATIINIQINNNQHAKLFIHLGRKLLRAAFRKYRPTDGTSSKFDFAHFWLIDNP